MSPKVDIKAAPRGQAAGLLDLKQLPLDPDRRVGSQRASLFLLLARLLLGARARLLRGGRARAHSDCQANHRGHDKRVHSAHEQVIYNPNRPSDAVPFVIARDHRRRVPRVDDRAGGLHSTARLAAVLRVCGVRRRRVPRDARARLERRPRAAPLSCWPRSVWLWRSALPLALRRVGPDSDMVRYLLGRPRAAPRATTRTSSCRRIRRSRTRTPTRPGRCRAANWRTPYPPSAQLFFRLVVGLHDSSRAMKLALIVCDLLTIVIVWRWLAMTGRREWLALVYAWNPLVVLEVAHSGHIDALGAMWIAASAYWLSRRRGRHWRRSRSCWRSRPSCCRSSSCRSTGDGCACATRLAGSRGVRCCCICRSAGGDTLPLGARARTCVAYIRFNGPVFRLIAAAATPPVAAATAVVLGLLVAVWARWRLEASDPAALGVADGDRARVRAGHLPVVPAVVHAFPVHQRHDCRCWRGPSASIPVYVVWEFSRRGGPLGRAGGIDGRGIRSAVADARGEGYPAPRARACREEPRARLLLLRPHHPKDDVGRANGRACRR